MKVVRVDLSKRVVKVSEVSKEFTAYIGGKGIATKLLYETLPPRVDPLSPENVIIFGIGPLNGVNLPGASRLTCVFKSPLTFGYGESQCGGFLAPEFKRAEVDFLFITGRAEKPVYLLVEDGEVEIKDASHLWGRDCYETEDVLRKDHGGEVLSIGQAGENLVRFACITHRRGRQFGRCGAGAVMGSKNLKAVVVKGSGEIEVADPDGLREFRKWMENIVSKLESMRRFGTPSIASLTNEAGVLPTKYWEKGSFEYFEEISAESLQKFVKRSTSCYGCSVACGKIRKARDAEVEGPEYETLFAFGSLCYNSDPESIIIANDLCDRYGLDTISTGNAIAFAMACSERGEISEEIRFGDGEKIIELVRKIAFRDGIGDILAEGVKRAAEILRVSVEPVHVKGLELPGYDPRGLYGMALAYVTSQRGACHMRSCAYRPNLSGVLDRFSAKGQAELVKEREDFYCIVDSLVYCRFLCLPVIGMNWEDVSKLLKIVTGRDYPVPKLKEIGEEIHNLTRRFNEREGVTDERLPEIFFEKPIGIYGRDTVVGREDFEEMLEDYRRLRIKASNVSDNFASSRK